MIEFIAGCFFALITLGLAFKLTEKKSVTTVDMTPPKQNVFSRTFKAKEKFKPKANDDETLYKIEQKEKTGLDQD